MARIPGALRNQGGLMRRLFVVIVYSLTQRRLGRVIMPIQVTAHHPRIFWGYLEMEQLRRAGLSFAQIFKAATISNAREFKLDSQVGTIEAGKIANLVLLKKSPLEGVDAYDTITTVWVHGKEIKRESLAADSGK